MLFGLYLSHLVKMILRKVGPLEKKAENNREDSGCFRKINIK